MPLTTQIKSPVVSNDRTVMTVWPSLAATRWGQWWGKLYQSRVGFRMFGIPVTLGRLTALVSIPFILPVYFHMLVPRLPFVLFGWPNLACRRYRLTDQSVLVEQPFGGGEQQSIPLDHFDAIAIEVLPGQAWYHAGDLVFMQKQVEVFRLAGIARPETFRQTCLKTQQSQAGVALAREVCSAV